MTELLQGTSVRATFSGQGVTLDVGGVSEFVEVSGSAAPAVSSPKYLVPLRDVPQTIAVIPREVIEEQGAFTLSDALRNVPGITLQAGEGGGASNTAGDMFNMRGFNASNSLFVDGVRDDGLIARDVFNLEQVEVFMGPTGSDVGRGTAAGYVNMQTKTPAPRLFDRGRLLRRLGGSAALERRLQLGRAAKDAAERMAEQVGVPPQRAVAGRRRARPRRRRARERGGRAVAGARPRNVDARDGRGAVPAAGQRARLRHSGRGLAGCAAGADDGAGRRRRCDQTNFYGSVDYDYDNASQNSVHGARRARRRARADAAQPDALQPDAPRGGHHRRSRTSRRSTRRRTS